MPQISRMTCPNCGAPLRFMVPFPVLASEQPALTLGDNTAERLRYIAVWQCEANECAYWRSAAPLEADQDLLPQDPP